MARPHPSHVWALSPDWVERLPRIRPAGWLFLALCTVSGPVDAQTLVNRPPSRVEVEVGGGVVGGSVLGSVDANLVANNPVRQSFRLFTTDSRFEPAPTFHARAGVAVNRRVVVEGGFAFSRPELRTAVSGDVEGVAPLTAVERIDQYFVEGGVVVFIDELSLSPRTVPFAAGGVGYLRQLHEGLTLIEHGHVYYVGGGLKHWLVARDRGRLRAAGLRADARLYRLADGISFDGRSRSHVAVSGGVFLGF